MRDTDKTPYDTGTFASTGTVVAGQAVEKTALALRDNILDFAARHLGCDVADCRLHDDAIICANRKIPLTELYAAGDKRAIASTSDARPISRRARSASTCTASASPCIASPARS